MKDLDRAAIIARLAASFGGGKFYRSQLVAHGAKNADIVWLRYGGYIATDEDNKHLSYITDHGMRLLTKVERLGEYIAREVA
jgi:hypothetical protein